LPSPELEPYVGEGASCQLIFSFVVNQALYLALVDEQAGPLINAIRRLPQPPPGCGWLGYLRNLDELTLSRLSDDERTRVVAALAPDPDMQIYGRGIRRRLAPMLDGNQDRLKLTMSLLFSLPYPPMVAYGEEIGMGDDLSLPERYSVHLPMQWNGRARNAGFSDAPQASMLRHVPHAGPYRPGKINVEDQQQDAQSLLHWVRRLIAERKQRQALFEGAWSLIKTSEPAVLVQKGSAQRRFLITAHNLSPQAKDVSIPMPEGDLPWIVLEHPSGCTLEWDGRESTLNLPGYGTCWLVQEPASCAEPATENENACGEGHHDQYWLPRIT
jgi:maltose alpha-D-glucosyltransferase/alpha-amylase